MIMLLTKKQDRNYLAMTNEQRILNLIGLALRARKIVTGEEFVIKEIQSNRAKIVFLASDASPSTQKKIQNKCTYYNVPCVTLFTTEQLSQAMGKPRKSCALCDAGFAKKVHELI